MRQLFLSRFEKQQKVVNPKIKSACFLFLLILSGVFPANKVFSQTTGENYIYVQEPKNAALTITPQTDAIRSVQYFDGLGRAKQTIQIKGTPNEKDIVIKIEYDGFGRQTKDFLPVPSMQDNGGYEANPEDLYQEYYNDGTYNGQTSFFNTEYYYSEKTLENSPLNRVLSQAAPGDTWKKGGGHEIEFEYSTNFVNEVRLFQVNADTGDLEENGFYAKNQLYKTITYDENGNEIKEFKDKQGRVILKQNLVENGHLLAGKPGLNNEFVVEADTYYVYDIYGNLAYVIPPLAAEKNTEIEGNEDSSDIIKNLCYLYRYDDRNRLVEKKLPGKGVEYMVYDRQDRLVAVQDANLRSQNKWLFTKYDKFGRVVYTGMTEDNRNRIDFQTYVNEFGNNNETTGNFIKNGLLIEYANSAFPINNIQEILTVNYYDGQYDGYNFPYENLEGLRTGGNEANKSLKGMATASYIRILGQGSWEKNYTAYDVLSRPVISHKNNHIGGYTRTKTELDFRGKPEQIITNHLRDQYGIEITLKEKFTYDHAERLTQYTHQVNHEPVQILTRNTYDELGRLTNKEVGGEGEYDRWQDVQYKYNIRGWLTDINDITTPLSGAGIIPPMADDDLFAFRIQYDEMAFSGYNFAEELYNGNIAQTFWKTGSDNIVRGYHYTYDKLNRLRQADFYTETNSNTDAYKEYLTYDVNGNITKLFRNTSDGYGSSQAVDMDDLTYEYQPDSNILINVTDTSGSDDFNGFIDGNTGPNDDYEYDDNGNMVLDRNKDIQSITYNHLNLPVRITFDIGKAIQYTYNAAGQKVNKTIENNGSYELIDYMDGFQYAGNILQYFPTPEGYVNVTARVHDYTPIAYRFNYVYNYTDHLGNIRLSYTKDPKTDRLRIIDQNHYYPFGLKHERNFPLEKWKFILDKENEEKTKLKVAVTDEYKYKYNGKEWQDELGLNFYDYGARNYDPSLGRFFNMDRYSDAYYHITPYQYTANNPVRLIDINGEYIWIYENGSKYKYENGKLYSENKETKKYDQEYTAEEGSYVAQIQGYLNQIGCEDCKEGKALLGFFENDERNITIRENKDKRPRYKEKNAFSRAGETVFTFFNEKARIPTVDGFEMISENFFTTLAHELGHAQSHFLYGDVAQEPWYTQYDSDGKPQIVRKDEVYATYVENKIRSENKLPLRTHYSSEYEFKANESSRVLQKVKGNWIMTLDAKVILNAIQAPSNRK